MPAFTCRPKVSVFLTLSLLTLAAPQAMACYTVYNRANVVVYSSMSPPIDMSYQIHERLPAVFPGGHLVFDTDNMCPEIDARKPASGTSGVIASANPVASPGNRKTPVGSK